MQGIRSWYYLINLAPVSKMRTDMLMLKITSHWDPQMDVNCVLQTERLLKYTGLLWRGSSLFFFVRLNKWLIFRFAFFFSDFASSASSKNKKIRIQKHIILCVCVHLQLATQVFAMWVSDLFSFKIWIIWPIFMKLATNFMKLCEVKRGNSAWYHYKSSPWMSHFLALINSMYQLEFSLRLNTETCTGPQFQASPAVLFTV